MKDYGWVILTCIAIFLAIASVFYLGSLAGYTNGYCSALGGEKINASVCNVNGRVVEVK